MANSVFDFSTIIKYLRNVLNEINQEYTDSGLRAGFIMKRYAERYKLDERTKLKLVLLCVLKDIGAYYKDGCIPKDNNALRAASSYSFLKYCSPLGEGAKPLLFYKAIYMEQIENDDYNYGLLITLIDDVSKLIHDKYTIEEIRSELRKERKGIYNPKQIKDVLKLLRDQPDILEKLNGSLFIYETTSYLSHINYSTEQLLSFIDMTNFSFEFHNHETLAHTVTTAIIAKELAKLSRLAPSQIEDIYYAGLVHDIGKIKIPISILCNPGHLQGNDLNIMRKHVDYTYQIIDKSLSYKIVEIARNHHEKLDGSGYPRGLKAIDLKIGDKVIAVADIASALYCKRSYKESMSENQICAILEREANDGKIEKRIVNHFIDNFDEIMSLAKAKEVEILNKYDAMQKEYNALIESKKLLSFFQYVEKPIEEEKAPVEEEKLELDDLIQPVDLQAMVNATFDGIYIEDDIEEKTEQKQDVEELTKPSTNENVKVNDINDINLSDEPNTNENQNERIVVDFGNGEIDLSEFNMNGLGKKRRMQQEVEAKALEPVKSALEVDLEFANAIKNSAEYRMINPDSTPAQVKETNISENNIVSEQKDSTNNEPVVEEKAETKPEFEEDYFQPDIEPTIESEAEEDYFNYDGTAEEAETTSVIQENSISLSDEGETSSYDTLNSILDETNKQQEEVKPINNFMNGQTDEEFEAFVNALNGVEPIKPNINNVKEQEVNEDDEFEAFVNGLSESNDNSNENNDTNSISEDEEFEAFVNDLDEKNATKESSEVNEDDEFEKYVNGLNTSNDTLTEINPLEQETNEDEEFEAFVDGLNEVNNNQIDSDNNSNEEDDFEDNFLEDSDNEDDFEEENESEDEDEEDFDDSEEDEDDDSEEDEDDDSEEDDEDDDEDFDDEESEDEESENDTEEITDNINANDNEESEDDDDYDIDLEDNEKTSNENELTDEELERISKLYCGKSTHYDDNND